MSKTVKYMTTRRAGQSIAIGNDIQVKVFEIDHDEVRLIIRAPIKISVRRLDTHEANQTEPEGR